MLQGDLLLNFRYILFSIKREFKTFWIYFISIHALTRSTTNFYKVMHFIGGISIHALTRSATFFLSIAIQKGWISIHALTRSATVQNPIPPFPNYFNPRTHEECDTIVLTIAWEPINFNPRTHEECDGPKSNPSISELFQSTHSRGVRHHCPCHSVGANKFQSTHSRGVRPYHYSPIRPFLRISIHALTRSATVSL